MAAEPAVRRHGPLEVDRASRTQVAEGAAGQRLVHDVRGEVGGAQFRDSEADSVRHDAVPHLRALENGACPDGQDRAVRAAVDALQGADFFD